MDHSTTSKSIWLFDSKQYTWKNNEVLVPSTMLYKIKWNGGKKKYISKSGRQQYCNQTTLKVFFFAVNNAINIKNISSNLIPFCSGLASRRSYYELVLLDAVKGLAFELFPSRLSRVQITAIFMWALSPPIWVSPRLFSEIQGLKHLYVLSFAVWCSVLHYRCVQHCPSTFTHSVNKTSSFFPFVVSLVPISFSQFHTWVSSKNEAKMERMFCSVLVKLPFLGGLCSLSPIISSSPLCLTTMLLSHRLLLWSLCLLSFFLPPLRFAPSQRDRNPPDLLDRRKRQRARADTPGGASVRTSTPQL